jgi:transcriptional regulator with XRE-family HTH domain
MAATVGSILKEEREAQQLSVEDVAHALKVHPARIRELEADDFSNFPNPTYARFFFRLYCRHLGVETTSDLAMLARGNLVGLEEFDYLRAENVIRTPRTPRGRYAADRWRQSLTNFISGALVLAAVIGVFAITLSYSLQRVGDWSPDDAADRAELPVTESGSIAPPVLPRETDPEAPQLVRPEEVTQQGGRPEPATPVADAGDEQTDEQLTEEIAAERDEAQDLLDTATLSPEQLRRIQDSIETPAEVSEEAIAESVEEEQEPPAMEPDDAGQAPDQDQEQRETLPPGTGTQPEATALPADPAPETGTP